MGYRYIGSKARIADDIIEYIGKPVAEKSVLLDAFSGTGVIAEKAADYGWHVHVNDMMRNAITMSEARLVSRSQASFNELGGYENTIKYLNSLNGNEGFIWREYSPASMNFCGIERRYFTEENAKKIDAISSKIHEWKSSNVISQQEFSVLMTDLISATNSVANIAGTYGCFLSKWTDQAMGSFFLKTSSLRENAVEYIVTNEDVFDLKSNPEDVVYLDPPYTKRQYASYYHILETLVCGDTPTVEGVAGLRPWKSKSSVFCYKTKALKALSTLVIQQAANRVVISYSNEGHIDLDDLVGTLSEFGEVKTISLGEVGRYRPNVVATNNNAVVKEYLIDFRKKKDINEQTRNT